MLVNEQTPVTYKWYFEPPSFCQSVESDVHKKMNLPLYLLDSIIFLEIFDKEEDDYKQIGTGFVISHTDGNNVFTYLVTCRHVIKDSLKKKIDVLARIPAKDGLRLEHVSLPNRWIYHEEESDGKVDLAVLPIESIKHTKPVEPTPTISSDMIYGREALRGKFTRDMEVGDDVIFMGLFKNYPGHFKNYPLVRYGRISLMPNDKMAGVEPWFGLSNYYLAECHAYPGISGAPVFVMRELDGKDKYALVGIMAGYYYEDEKKDMKKFTHYGISQIIPIEKLGNIIFGEDLENARQTKIRGKMMDRGPEPASANTAKEEKRLQDATAPTPDVPEDKN